MAVIILEPGAPGKNLTTQAVYTIFRFRLKIRVENTDHRFLAGFARGDWNSLWIGSENHCGESATESDGGGWRWMAVDGGGWRWMAVDGGGWRWMAGDGGGRRGRELGEQESPRRGRVQLRG